jgi:hypothetical protein
MGIGSVGTLDENLREGALPGIANSPHAATAARSRKTQEPKPTEDLTQGPDKEDDQLSRVGWGPTREGEDSSQVGEKAQVKFVRSRQVVTRFLRHAGC